MPKQAINFNVRINPKIEIHKTTGYQTIGPSFANSSAIDVALQGSKYTPELFTFPENLSKNPAISGCLHKCKS